MPCVIIVVHVMKPSYIHHTLRDFPKTMQVWNNFNFSSHIHFYEDDIYNWMKINTFVNHEPLFLICCWMIWKSHNEESFKDNSRSLWNILSQITALLHSTKHVSCDSKILAHRLVSWHPSMENVIKINVAELMS